MSGGAIAGTVVDQRPRPGRPTLAGARITLYVSTGPAPVSPAPAPPPGHGHGHGHGKQPGHGKHKEKD